MKYIVEKHYVLTYTPDNCSYEDVYHCLANSIEEAISMCRDKYKGCTIKRVEKLSNVHRKSTKTITVEV